MICPRCKMPGAGVMVQVARCLWRGCYNFDAREYRALEEAAGLYALWFNGDSMKAILNELSRRITAEATDGA